MYYWTTLINVLFSMNLIWYNMILFPTRQYHYFLFYTKQRVRVKLHLVSGFEKRNRNPDRQTNTSETWNPFICLFTIFAPWKPIGQFITATKPSLLRLTIVYSAIFCLQVHATPAAGTCKCGDIKMCVHYRRLPLTFLQLHRPLICCDTVYCT